MFSLTYLLKSFIFVITTSHQCGDLLQLKPTTDIFHAFCQFAMITTLIASHHFCFFSTYFNSLTSKHPHTVKYWIQNSVQRDLQNLIVALSAQCMESQNRFYRSGIINLTSFRSKGPQEQLSKKNLREITTFELQSFDDTKYAYTFMTEVLIISKPVHGFSQQISGLISV